MLYFSWLFGFGRKQVDHLVPKHLLQIDFANFALRKINV